MADTNAGSYSKVKHDELFKELAIRNFEQKLIAQKRFNANVDVLEKHAKKKFELYIARAKSGGEIKAKYSGEAAAMLEPILTVVHEIADNMGMTSDEVAYFYELIPLKKEYREEK